MAPEIDTWLKLLGAGITVAWLCIGAVVYVWREDRKRLLNVERHKADKTDVGIYHSDHKNDVREIREDIKDVRNLIITLMGVKEK